MESAIVNHKLPDIRASDIKTIGRNTQGVRIIRLDEGDTLVSCAVIPGDVIYEEAAKAAAAQVVVAGEKRLMLPNVADESFESADE